MEDSWKPIEKLLRTACKEIVNDAKAKYLYEAMKWMIIHRFAEKEKTS